MIRSNPVSAHWATSPVCSRQLAGGAPKNAVTLRRATSAKSGRSS
jgi:hypothetical protein